MFVEDGVSSVTNGRGIKATWARDTLRANSPQKQTKHHNGSSHYRTAGLTVPLPA